MLPHRIRITRMGETWHAEFVDDPDSGIVTGPTEAAALGALVLLHHDRLDLHITTVRPADMVTLDEDKEAVRGNVHT